MTRTYHSQLNDEQALEILERPSHMWRGQTAVDVAILSQSKLFIEQCCGAALDYRYASTRVKDMTHMQE